MLHIHLKFAAPVLVVFAFGAVTIGLFACCSAVAEQSDHMKEGSAKTRTEDKDKQQEDMEKLRGTWKVEKVQYGGEEHASRFQQTITFAGNKIAWQQKTMFRDGTFKLDSKKEPREIDWTLGEFVPVKMLGIYRLEGDKLILSMSPDDHYFRDIRRPTNFATKKKEPQLIYTLTRQPSEAKVEAKGKEAKQMDARLRCSSTMNQIMLAMHNYHEEHGHFPHPAICDKEGKPLLSWRVALLPNLGYRELYKQFKLDEPWDSKHNKKLLAKIPKVYASLGLAPEDAHVTFYQVFVGNGAAFQEKMDITIRDITDGTSNTIFVVEAWNPVPWTKPADLPYDPAKELPMLGGMIRDGLCTFVLGDGSAHTTKNVVEAKVLHALITRNGEEVVNLEDLDR
jgi:uncharacterized protein (TIGR03067 family)